jgi:hypothetical protein
MRRVNACILLLCAAVALFGQNRQGIIPYDSPLVAELGMVYRELGMALPSDTAPWTEAEFLLMLDRVYNKKERLSPGAKTILAGIRKELEKKPVYTEFDGALAVDASLSIALEGYLGLMGDDDDREWLRGYGEREALLFVPVELYLLDNFYAMTSLSLTQDYFAVLDRQKSGSNVPLGFNDLESMYPLKTALSAGGDHWNIRFARDTLNWGSGKTGNLLLGANGTVHDFIELSTFWNRFKFTFLLLGQDTSLWDETTTYTAGNETFFAPVYDNKNDDFADAVSSQETVRNFLAHRLEFRLRDNLRLVFTEAVMYQDPTLQFRYLNPMMAFHNWYQTGSANYFITLEADYLPRPGVRLYGQFLGDQIAFYFNRQGGTYSDVPAAMGYLAGIDLQKPVNEGYLYGGLEWVKLDPYNYIDRSGINLWYQRRILSNYLGGHQALVLTPLGYEKGPDSMTFYGEFGYLVPGRWDAKLSAEFFVKGENTITTVWTDEDGAAQDVTPSGSHPVQTLILGIEGGMNGSMLGISDSVSLSTGVNLIHVENFLHDPGKDFWDLQIWLSGKYRF